MVPLTTCVWVDWPSKSSNHVYTKLSACHRVWNRSKSEITVRHCSYDLQAVKAEELSQEEPVSLAAHAEQSNQQPQGSQNQLDPCEPCGPGQITKRRMPKWGRAMQSRSSGLTSIQNAHTTECKGEEGMSHCMPMD